MGTEACLRCGWDNPTLAGDLNPMTQLKSRNSVLAAVLLAGTALGGLGASLAPAAAQGAAAPIAAPSVPALPGFADLVSRVRPAVVTITSTERVQAQPAGSPFPQGSSEDQRFRRYFGEQDQGRGRRPDGNAPGQAAKALGSGFLVDAQGHVVTNNHVVEGASRVVVTLEDGRDLEAKVIGRDPSTDVAVLQVDGGAGLPFLSLGDSDTARPGDWVVAMGNPFGLGGTVTAGIVSARGRNIGAGPYDDFLQVDAPINRGNSGGPLFNTAGAVVGVNTAIFSPSGGSVGIGFAIPSNVVKAIVSELEAHGRVDRSFLGVTTQPVDTAMAAALKLSKPEGALVSDVQPDSPAAAAGMQPGDVVTAVNGAGVSDPRALARAVASLKPGAAAQLAVQRDGAGRTVTVTPALLPDKAAPAAREDAQASGGIGLALAPLDGAAREALNVPPETKGSVIAAVRPGGPASEAGLRPGDVVVGVGNHSVATPADTAKAIGERPAGTGAVALRVLRDGHSLFVAVPGT